MKVLKKLLNVVALACLVPGAVQAGGDASSTFDDDADGWYVSDNMGKGAVAASWSDGIIGTIDQFSETSFHAPSKFNGDKSSLYGGTLSFDLTETSRDANAGSYYTALIASGDTVLYWYGGAPLTVFTTFVATLSEQDSRWRLGGTGFGPNTGAAPTAEQFLSVLSNVTRLQINGEFITGPDNTHLDNVFLGPVPEPSTYALLAAGLLAVASAVRSKRGRSCSSGIDAGAVKSSADWHR